MRDFPRICGGNRRKTDAYFYNKNKENNIEDKIAQLNQTLESTEHTFNYPLSISSGYACFLPEMDSTFKDLAKRSDLMLYRIKRKRKLAYAGNSELLTANTLINTGTSTEEKLHEEIFSHTENYQDLSLKELCNIINLSAILEGST